MRTYSSSTEPGRVGITAIQRILSDFRNDCDEWQCEFEELLEETVVALAGRSDPYSRRGRESDSSWAEINRRLSSERDERREERADMARELHELRLLVESQMQHGRPASSGQASHRSTERTATSTSLRAATK